MDLMETEELAADEESPISAASEAASSLAMAFERDPPLDDAAIQMIDDDRQRRNLRLA